MGCASSTGSLPVESHAGTQNLSKKSPLMRNKSGGILRISRMFRRNRPSSNKKEPLEFSNLRALQHSDDSSTRQATSFLPMAESSKMLKGAVAPSASLNDAPVVTTHSSTLGAFHANLHWHRNNFALQACPVERLHSSVRRYAPDCCETPCNEKQCGWVRSVETDEKEETSNGLSVSVLSNDDGEQEYSIHGRHDHRSRMAQYRLFSPMLTRQNDSGTFFTETLRTRSNTRAVRDHMPSVNSSWYSSSGSGSSKEESSDGEDSEYSRKSVERDFLEQRSPSHKGHTQNSQFRDGSEEEMVVSPQVWTPPRGNSDEKNSASAPNTELHLYTDKNRGDWGTSSTASGGFILKRCSETAHYRSASQDPGDEMYSTAKVRHTTHLHIDRDPNTQCTILNHYMIIRALGKGNATVYLALNLQINRLVSLKIILRSPVSETECSFLRHIRHPNIGTLYERIDDCTADSIVLVLEYIPKGSVVHLTQRGRCVEGALSEPVVGRILGDVLQALSYLHGLNIVHGDIKPSNLMLNQDDIVKLIDFGAAHYTTEEAHQLTPMFAPPEKDEAHTNGCKADIWSLGLVAYVMLVGGLPRELFATQNVSAENTGGLLFLGDPCQVLRKDSFAAMSFRSAVEKHHNHKPCGGNQSYPDSTSTNSHSHSSLRPNLASSNNFVSPSCFSVSPTALHSADPLVESIITEPVDSRDTPSAENMPLSSTVQAKSSCSESTHQPDNQWTTLRSHIVQHPFLSPEAKDFLSLSLALDPEQRPSAEDLLAHPLVHRHLRKDNRSKRSTEYLLQ